MFKMLDVTLKISSRGYIELFVRQLPKFSWKRYFKKLKNLIEVIMQEKQKREVLYKFRLSNIHISGNTVIKDNDLFLKLLEIFTKSNFKFSLGFLDSNIWTYCTASKENIPLCQKVTVSQPSTRISFYRSGKFVGVIGKAGHFDDFKKYIISVETR